MPGTLYVVATPIGNLGDLSPRAREVLSSVALVAGETQESTLRLLSAAGIRGPRFVLYQERNREQSAQRLLEALEQGESVALVSDGGTPAISDPGRELVDRAHRAGIPVRAVAGPSSVTAALSVSGLKVRRFAFEGFLPRKSSERRALLRSLQTESRALVFFEAPHRIEESLADLRATFPARRLSVSRELTKLHEETLIDPDIVRAQGEFCIVVEEAPEQVAPEVDPMALEGLLELKLGSRVSARILELFAGLSHKTAYRMIVEKREAEGDPPADMENNS
ncbi:MAG: ribosomal RNA small subunit methyltransferase I [Candidatus Xenobia bacterium]